MLISLLGDKLNSGKVEFGLDGGANFFSLAGVPDSDTATGFHLGFYFDIKTKHQWLFHTGVIVKSPLGAHGLPVYPLGNPDLDQAFQGGIVSRNLRCSNVPVMIKYPFRNHFYAEGGII
ncbi:MAG: PorT family protein, partial [Cyclobacteriaceae bacterium]